MAVATGSTTGACGRRVYGIVLREGLPGDVLTYIDGARLADLWDELVLSGGHPRSVELRRDGSVAEELARRRTGT